MSILALIAIHFFGFEGESLPKLLERRKWTENGEK